MRDIVRIGDIVCYATGNKIEVGRVVAETSGKGEFTIVPIKKGFVKKRKSSQLITARRLAKLSKSSNYVYPTI